MLNLNQGEVELQDYPWAIQGDVVGRLTSEIFGLQQARSKEAEEAIEAAEAFLRGGAQASSSGMKNENADPSRFGESPPGYRSVLAQVDCGDRAVIRVKPKPEPATFDTMCRQNGLEWLGLRDGEVVVRYGREWFKLYQNGDLTLRGLKQVATQIAAAVERDLANGKDWRLSRK